MADLKFRQSFTEADLKLRTARTAREERVRLIGIREALAPDVAEAEAHAASLEEALAAENADVKRYEGGVWATLYGIFFERELRLTKEQREAAAAHARFLEAAALRDRLREEVTALGARIDALANAESELAAARAQKQAAMLAARGPSADELGDIAMQLGGIDADVLAIDEAVTAGVRAQAALFRLREVLASARNWGTADIFSDSLFVSWAKRNKLDEARNLAGVAQAELGLFRREMSDVGVALAAETTGLADHHRFLDTWLDNIFSDLSVQKRIAHAQGTTDHALANVNGSVTTLHNRRKQHLARRDELMKQRTDLIERSEQP